MKRLMLVTAVATVGSVVVLGTSKAQIGVSIGPHGVSIHHHHPHHYSGDDRPYRSRHYGDDRAYRSRHYGDDRPYRSRHYGDDRPDHPHSHYHPGHY
jgi:hypothetical protein